MANIDYTSGIIAYLVDVVKKVSKVENVKPLKVSFGTLIMIYGKHNICIAQVHNDRHIVILTGTASGVNAAIDGHDMLTKQIEYSMHTILGNNWT